MKNRVAGQALDLNIIPREGDLHEEYWRARPNTFCGNNNPEYNWILCYPVPPLVKVITVLSISTNLIRHSKQNLYKHDQYENIFV